MARAPQAGPSVSLPGVAGAPCISLPSGFTQEHINFYASQARQLGCASSVCCCMRLGSLKHRSADRLVQCIMMLLLCWCLCEDKQSCCPLQTGKEMKLHVEKDGKQYAMMPPEEAAAAVQVVPCSPPASRACHMVRARRAVRTRHVTSSKFHARHVGHGCPVHEDTVIPAT